MFGCGLGLELAADGERGDGLQDGEGRAPLAGRREVADAYLVAGEGEGVVVGGEYLSFSEAHFSMVDRGVDPRPTHR